MAPAKNKPAKDASPSQSEEASQRPSQEALHVDEDALAQIAQIQNAKIAKLKAEGEERIRNIRKKRIHKVQKKISECQQRHQERSRDQIRPMVDRLRELLNRKRSLEAQQDEHFQQVTSAMKATVEQLNVAIQDRCGQLAERD
ncbi:uncharacterized protein RCC_03800 [Ramularia collo-cygni]|uniref:Uncharacterized protein n=1 Tax=Ramularia collo-cygni TaxID=112498 RepID=A0A2D3UQF9_9PEZI|nr:uncharacterized protein RCC_03800 [Ramularia collo-cygni]CZT17961.1 uncharacterized protein RCC_03800 [Ramularia collo-cygni]